MDVLSPLYPCSSPAEVFTTDCTFRPVLVCWQCVSKPNILAICRLESICLFHKIFSNLSYGYFWQVWQHGGCEGGGFQQACTFEEDGIRLWQRYSSLVGPVECWVVQPPLQPQCQFYSNSCWISPHFTKNVKNDGDRFWIQVRGEFTQLRENPKKSVEFRFETCWDMPIKQGQFVINICEPNCNNTSEMSPLRCVIFAKHNTLGQVFTPCAKGISCVFRLLSTVCEMWTSGGFTFQNPSQGDDTFATNVHRAEFQTTYFLYFFLSNFPIGIGDVFKIMSWYWIDEGEYLCTTLVQNQAHDIISSGSKVLDPITNLAWFLFFWNSATFSPTWHLWFLQQLKNLLWQPKQEQQMQLLLTMKVKMFPLWKIQPVGSDDARLKNTQQFGLFPLVHSKRNGFLLLVSAGSYSAPILTGVLVPLALLILGAIIILLLLRYKQIRVVEFPIPCVGWLSEAKCWLCPLRPISQARGEVAPFHLQPAGRVKGTLPLCRKLKSQHEQILLQRIATHIRIVVGDTKTKAGQQHHKTFSPVQTTTRLKTISIQWQPQLRKAR